MICKGKSSLILGVIVFRLKQAYREICQQKWITVMHIYPNVSCLILSSWYEILNKPSMLFDPGLLNMRQIVQSKELTGFYHLRHCYNCYNYLFYLPSNCANSSLIASITWSWLMRHCLRCLFLLHVFCIVSFGVTQLLGFLWLSIVASLGSGVGIGAEVVDCVMFSSLKSDLASRRLLKTNVNPGGKLQKIMKMTSAYISCSFL